jgi:glycosyltransferase involved in cell wall biosynthesis
MRFHCLGVQHTITNKDYVACAFTQKVLKFCEMMTQRGHTIIHYGHEDSNLVCTEHVTVVTRDEFNTIYGIHDHRSKLFKFDIYDAVYQIFNQRAIEEITKRKQVGDFVLAFWGTGHKAICDALWDMCIVEPGIGYSDTFAPYRVFESYALYHAKLGMSRVQSCFVHDDDFENDTIIPNYYDPNDFELARKEDYFLFVGRVGVAKGLDRAIALTKNIGIRLIVAGQNAEAGFREVGAWPIPDHVEYVGYVGVEERKRLMARARAVLCFSKFVEPFCGVHAESMLSGTPVITSDWGAMTEFVIEGVTGFRCRTLDDMIEAGTKVQDLTPSIIRNWAISKFSFDAVAPLYETFFERLYKKNTIIDYEKIQKEEQPFADRLGPCLVRQLHPKKFLDLGCGPGMHVRVMDSLGVDSLGIELDDRAQDPRIKNESILELHGKYTADLVMSLEVAEHIPEEFADDIVQNVVDSIEPGGTLVWTAAHPGQGGIGHINCQPREYWIEKFTRQGLIQDETLEKNIREEMLQGYHMGWFIMNLIVFKKPEGRILVWGPTDWAIGRITNAIQKYVPNVDVVDWKDADKTHALFDTDRWKMYSHIVSKTDLLDYEEMFGRSAPQGFYERLIVICHCSRTGDPYFHEKIIARPGTRYVGVSQETCSMIRDSGIEDVFWVPFGVDLDVFPYVYTSNLCPIKRIGLVCDMKTFMTHEAYKACKRPDMFLEICARTGASPVIITDRTDPLTMYDDIDLLISCSEFETGPLGVFEASAMGKPVLIRRVGDGNAQRIKGIRTFETIDDAVEQIHRWNENLVELDAYAIQVTLEVQSRWNMRTCVERFANTMKSSV